MIKLLCSTFLFLLVGFSAFSQTEEIEISDSLQKVLVKRDSIIFDSLLYAKDTIHLIQKDTVVFDTAMFYVAKDTIDEVFFSDSIGVGDTLPKNLSYEMVMKSLRDSLIFEEPDSVDYIIYNLNRWFETDETLNDSIKQAVFRLSNFITSQNIDTTIRYLQTQISSKLTDSVLDSSSDSIYYNIKYLIESIPEDSVKLLFINSKNDSILLASAENEKDSVRLNLFDNRSEYGVLWLKKSEDNTLNIFLEDGIYIEKARQKKVVIQELDSKLIIPGLKKVKKVNKIIPIWAFDGLADMKFSQGYISDSWSEGGENSVSALSVLKYSADYSYGKLRSLDTDFEYRLGYIKAGDNELQKNDDKFEINAKYGRSAINNWYYSALLNFKTQFFKGKEYVNDSTVNVISEFLSPAYLVFSLGFDYKPSNKLTVMISPITSKFTIVADTVNYDQARFGVGKDEFVRKEIGAYVKAISKLKFRDNINLENKINFFTNYTNNPQNIDVDWEVNLKVKLTDYINISVNAHFIYDDDVAYIDEDGRERGARPQFKELFGVGFTYSF